MGTRFFSFFYHRAVAIRAFSETPFALRAIELEYGILAKKTYEILLIPPPFPSNIRSMKVEWKAVGNLPSANPCPVNLLPIPAPLGGQTMRGVRDYT